MMEQKTRPRSPKLVSSPTAAFTRRANWTNPLNLNLSTPRGGARTVLLAILGALALYGALSLANDVFGSQKSLGVGPRQLFMDDMMEYPNSSLQTHSCGELSADQRGTSTWHWWDDSELYQQAALVKDPGPECVDPPKIAFMFLARTDIPLAPFWRRYFKGHEGLYSIYVHSSDPNYRIKPNNTLFWGRQVPSAGASRNGHDMVDAELRILANALLDPLNSRFILLSESCVPVRPFKSLYKYLKDCRQSNVESYNVSGRNPRTGGRWKEQLLPLVPQDQFRKGSQWFEMHRRHARLVVGDRRFWDPIKDMWTVSDEHYIPSLFPLFNIEHQITTQTMTHVNWTGVVHSHPTQYSKEEIQPWLIEMLQASSNTTYFARKFGKDTLEPLLKLPKSVLGF